MYRSGSEHRRQRCCRPAGGRSLRKRRRLPRGALRPPSRWQHPPAARRATAGSRSPQRRSQPLPPGAEDCGAAAAPHPEARRPRAAPPRAQRPPAGGQPSPADDRHMRGFHARRTRNHHHHAAGDAATALKNARSPPTAPAMSRPSPLAPATSAAIGRAPRPSAATRRARPVGRPRFPDGRESTSLWAPRPLAPGVGSDAA